MTCYYPMQAYRGKELTKNGKRKIVFNRSDAFYPELAYNNVTVGCGQCIGCRLQRSRDWAIRCVHEARFYDDNCFITLTYNEKYLPKDKSLDIRHFQLFMKRLRKEFGNGIRFYACGEYGERFGRPHYHAILFNHDFPDKTLFKEENGQKLFRSKILERLWPYGYSSVGSCSFESAAYVARYILKKVNGDDAFWHYNEIDVYTGEILNTVKPEYTHMSRRPGIGKKHFEKYKNDIFPRDYVVFKNKKILPPKYYASLYELTNPDELANIKQARKRKALLCASDNTPERLAVKEYLKKRQLDLLPRNLDNGVFGG